MSPSLLLVLGLFGQEVSIDTNKAEAKAHFEKAETQYRLGRFEEALVEYSSAYELFADPAFLFNLGQCHRNLKNWEQAAFLFRSYLKGRPDAPDRVRVESLIVELEAKAAPEDATAAEGQASPALVATSAPPAEEDSILEQWWLWAAVGAVVAGTTVAIVVASQGASGLPDDLPAGASVLDFRDR